MVREKVFFFFLVYVFFIKKKNIVLMWKIVGASKVSVLYIYIDYIEWNLIVRDENLNKSTVKGYLMYSRSLSLS